MEYFSTSLKDTQKIASELIKAHQNGALICLYGELGTGKTVFAKGMAKALGIPEKEVKSPTFTILKEYNLGEAKLYHYDFYRHTEADPILIQQFEEYQSNPANFFFIEWAENIMDILPEQRIDVHLNYEKEPLQRKITIIKHEQRTNQRDI